LSSRASGAIPIGRPRQRGLDLQTDRVALRRLPCRDEAAEGGAHGEHRESAKSSAFDHAEFEPRQRNKARRRRSATGGFFTHDGGSPGIAWSASRDVHLGVPEDVRGHEANLASQTGTGSRPGGIGRCGAEDGEVS